MLSTEQVKASFAGAGYQVGAPIYWESSELTTFFVRDAIETNRTALVLVYPDATRADEQRLMAQAQEQADLGVPSIFSAELGPELLPGYSRSYWLGNVALVQALQAVPVLEEDQTARIVTRASRRAELAALGGVDADFADILRGLAPIAIS
jgi:hypothetical protein